MALDIKKSFNDEKKVWNVELTGEVDIYTSNILKETLNELILKEETDIVLDCEKLDYIDSTGLGVLIGILKRLKNNEKNIIIANPKSNISKLFKITGLDKIFIME
ncbi:anti-sigma B factor antagonist [Caminicella sporogenes DSM 14501]|uniref:Anti-sigma factor antagonist n=1 Tax=Caminicella sporogenes DSM 14501 TaxID=1121266 RepID=A0A1M6NBU4_9FIRM|nr:STAS domain-containing protein [Caminicella sporogenes]RKD22256.1 anti-anti-sigma factor [Caminicella sporogenes]WIF95885.1 STAS domain-containing protein [Caminicella sporogenes]SHJ93144.1 anti-sigma B factor antagonist [Caminicella sporogenes DSM 14501]